MKKIGLILVFSVAVFASCHKNRVCSCTQTVTNSGTTTTSESNVLMEKVTNSEANEQCEAIEESANSLNADWAAIGITTLSTCTVD